MEPNKNAVSRVVNNFIKVKRKMERKLARNSEIFTEEFFDGKKFNYNNEESLYKYSSTFLPFLRKFPYILNLPIINKFTWILKKIFNEGFLSVSKLDGESEEMQKQAINFIEFQAHQLLDFDDFIKNYSVINRSLFLKQFFLNSCGAFMFLSLGQLKNFNLFDKILRLWIIFDNLSDNKPIIKDTVQFLVKRLFLNSDSDEINEYFRIRGNPVVECIRGLYMLNISETIKMDIFERLRDIYKYIYSKKNKKKRDQKITEYNVLKYSSIKSCKAFCIFSHAFGIKNIQNDERIYNICLVNQLVDDILDMRDDIANNNKTSFLIDNPRGRLASVLALNRLMKKESGKSYYLLKSIIIISLSYNAKYFEGNILGSIEKNVRFVNLKAYNMENIFEILEDSDFLVTCTKIYINAGVIGYIEEGDEYDLL